MTKSEFLKMAKAIKVTLTIDGKSYEASPKVFSTGSVGWSISQKVEISVGDENVGAQLGLNLTASGSKGWK